MPLEQLPRASNFVPEAIFAGGLVDKIGSAPNQLQAGLNFAFYNSLNVDVIVAFRTGVKYVISRRSGSGIKGFVIRTSYWTTPTVKVDTHDLLNDTGQLTSNEASLIERSIVDDTALKVRSTGIVDYVLQYSDFEQHGGSVYLENLDITLSLADLPQAPSHPFSLAGIRKRLIHEYPDLTEGRGLSYNVRIIDRLGRFGNRFINLGGEVFLVVAERNNTDLQDGVYAVSNHPVIGEQTTPLPRSRFFSFEVAEKELHLYRTFNEAKTLGNPQDVYRRELDDRKLELARREQEWAEQKVQWKREEDERKRAFEQESHAQRMRLMEREERAREREYQLNEREYHMRLFEQRLKNEEARIRRDSMILKEAFENRALNRKEIIEILKYIPTLIGGVAALYMAVKKLKG